MRTRTALAKVPLAVALLGLPTVATSLGKTGTLPSEVDRAAQSDAVVTEKKREKKRGRSSLFAVIR